MEQDWKFLLGTILGDLGDLKTYIHEAWSNEGRLKDIENKLRKINERFEEVTAAYNRETKGKEEGL